jgi:hypothetical protein
MLRFNRKGLGWVYRILPAFVMVLSACASQPVSPSAAAPNPQLSQIPAGAPCHSSQSRSAQDLSPEFGSGPAIGPGPIYARLADDGFAHQAGDGGWGYAKVLWLVGPDVHGLLRIQGRQLDGSHQLRFGSGSNPDAELVLTVASSSAGWTNFPSYIRGSTSGCYGVKVQGTSVSEIIVFVMKCSQCDFASYSLQKQADVEPGSVRLMSRG